MEKESMTVLMNYPGKLASFVCVGMARLVPDEILLILRPLRL